jgi:hypothetical protein
MVYMLTDKEQKARALKVSSLYLTPLKQSPKALASRIETYKWMPTLKAATLFSIPLFCANTLYNFYFLGTYTNVTDIQAASILFIVLLFGLFGLFVICFRASFAMLYNTYSRGGTIFWLVFVTTFTLVPFIRVLTTGSAGQGILELLVRCSIFALSCTLLTGLIFVSITKIVLQLTNQK